MNGRIMQIETDPVLRADPLWLALEHAITAVTDEPRILYEKKNEWEGGLNSEKINKLAQDAKLSDHAVYASETLTDGEGDRKWDTERWLKVSHPVFDEPLAIKMWDRVSPHRPTQSQVDRLIAYLKAWQQTRAEQIGPVAKTPKHIETQTTRREKRTTWLAEAILIVQDDPNLSIREIARKVKKAASTLIRSEVFVMAQKMAQKPKSDLLPGYNTFDPETGLRGVEAISPTESNAETEARDKQLDADIESQRNTTQRKKAKNPGKYTRPKLR